MDKIRCAWCGTDPLYQAYHDQEWGVPVWDDVQLFEFLTLEAAQAGLSWITILRKRENFRKAFDKFNPEKIARYDARKLASLMKDEGIVRNRMKIDGARQSARAWLKIQEEGPGFSKLLWNFVDGAPKITVTNRDIREIQMAKAALYSGARLLMDKFGVDQVEKIVLAGAFGALLLRGQQLLHRGNGRRTRRQGYGRDQLAIFCFIVHIKSTSAGERTSAWLRPRSERSPTQTDSHISTSVPAYIRNSCHRCRQ